jgi:CheY-like chemotaxis protein
MLNLHRFAILAGACLCACCGWAQDPFGEPGDFAPAAPGPAAVPVEEEENPLVRQLLEFSGRGNPQLAESIASLARINRWSEVDRLLQQLSARKLAAPQLAELYRFLGPTLYLRLKQHPELSDSAKAGLDQMSAAAISEAESPQRLQEAIAQLTAESVDARLAAARTLLSGGNAAIAQLVSAAVAEQTAVSRDEILRMLVPLGSGGRQALRQLALYGEPGVRPRALASLARIRRSAHLVDLVTALHALDASEPERELARVNLSGMAGGVPDLSTATQVLELDFADRRQAALLVDNDDQTTTLWELTEDRRSVRPQTASRISAAYREAVDAGARLRRVGSLSSQRASEVLMAEMAYRVLVDPDWGDAEQVGAIRDLYGQSAGSESVSLALAHALDASDFAAAIGLIRLIEPATASVLDRNVWLDGQGSSETPLVRAVSSPEPQVRFEAALAAARLAGDAPYPGSSQVRRGLSEMVSLSDKPVAILVETRPEVVLRLEGILTDLGYAVDVVGTVANVQRRVARGGDLRLILSKTELADLPPIEMVDLVRRLPRGRDVPIAFYGADGRGLGEQRWRAPTVLIELPASPAALDALLDSVQRRRSLPPLSAIDRQVYRQAAAELLGDRASTGPAVQAN